MTTDRASKERELGALREITPAMRAAWNVADQRARRAAIRFRIVFALVALVALAFVSAVLR